jgi:hypothetical protein
MIALKHPPLFTETGRYPEPVAELENRQEAATLSR